MNEAPRYPHDLPKSVFLGQYEEYDLYYSDHMGMPTVVARSGPGPNYDSGMDMADMPEVFPQLAEAKRRARERNLKC